MYRSGVFAEFPSPAKKSQWTVFSSSVTTARSIVRSASGAGKVKTGCCCWGIGVSVAFVSVSDWDSHSLTSGFTSTTIGTSSVFITGRESMRRCCLSLSSSLQSISTSSESLFESLAVSLGRWSRTISPNRTGALGRTGKMVSSFGLESTDTAGGNGSLACDIFLGRPGPLLAIKELFSRLKMII